MNAQKKIATWFDAFHGVELNQEIIYDMSQSIREEPPEKQRTKKRLTAVDQGH